jgi:hypothetical protein
MNKNEKIRLKTDVPGGIPGPLGPPINKKA